MDSGVGIGEIVLLLGTTIFSLAVVGFYIATIWRIFTKANRPGWASLVPIYSTLEWLGITGKPAWWLVLLLIPGVNLVMLIILTVELARVFGKDGGFAVGLILLPAVFLPLLAFGDARYQPAQFQPARY